MGFDQMLDMWLSVKYAQPVRRTICPVCAYPLEDTDRGLHCKNCTWHESASPPKFIPRSPENPLS